MANRKSPKNALINWLEDRHDQIMACETGALEALHANKVEAYREGMKQKAQMLAALAREALPLLKELPPDLRAEVETSLEKFSASAQNSLGLNSVFYMSALLYPDNYKTGEPDNMALFINTLKDW